MENYIKKLVDIELLNIIKTNTLQNPNNALDMNSINEKCISILIGNCTDPDGISNNYKKQLKQLLNLPDSVFVKSTQENKPHQLVTFSTQANFLNAHADSIADESDIRSL